MDATTLDSRELYGLVKGVPEHNISLMCRASGGRALQIDDYIFYAADEWLVGIGYPLSGSHDLLDAEAFDEALKQAVEKTEARYIRVAAPLLPARLEGMKTKEDHFFLLDLEAGLPARMERVAAKFEHVLRIRRGRSFTPEHRRLWGEFTGQANLAPDVEALYGKVEELILSIDCEETELVDAWSEDESGASHLAASLVVDGFAPDFDVYVLGARSRRHAAPHASDVLFARMIADARARKKRWLHLGLGVNEGIARFKRKWGGFAAFPYVEASWREEKKAASVNVILRSMEASFDLDKEEREIRQHDYAQRPFRMLWKLEKNGRTSWIGGTAHFFCKSFEKSFKKLYEHVDTVLFEGHLDDRSLEKVALCGKTPPEPSACLYDLLTEEERAAVERVVRGPEGFFARLLNICPAEPVDVRWHLRRTRHWYAFFALWCAFLERKGWRYSVDLEAWRLAHAQGKRVLAMEDIEEQLEALRAVPVERAVNHLRACRQWPRLLRANARAYLAGDLEGLMGTSTEFPTRTGLIIGERDRRFHERMLPYIEAGNALALVGSAHLVNLRGMLKADGFVVTPINHGLFGRRLK